MLGVRSLVGLCIVIALVIGVAVLWGRREGFEVCTTRHAYRSLTMCQAACQGKVGSSCTAAGGGHKCCQSSD